MAKKIKQTDFDLAEYRRVMRVHAIFNRSDTAIRSIYENKAMTLRQKGRLIRDISRQASRAARQVAPELWTEAVRSRDPKTNLRPAVALWHILNHRFD